MRLENQRNNNISVYRRDGNHDLNISASSRSVMSKEELIDEFENQKRKREKGKKAIKCANFAKRNLQNINVIVDAWFAKIIQV